MTMQACPNGFNVCGLRAAEIDPCTREPVFGATAAWQTNRIKEWNATLNYRDGERFEEEDGCGGARILIVEDDCPDFYTGTALFQGTPDHEFLAWVQGDKARLLTSGGNTVGYELAQVCVQPWFWVEVWEKLDYGQACAPAFPSYRRHIFPKTRFRVTDTNLVKGIRNVTLEWRAEAYRSPEALFNGPWADIPNAFNIFDPDVDKDYLYANYDDEFVPTGQCGLQSLTNVS